MTQMTDTYDTNDEQYGEHDGRHTYDTHDDMSARSYSMRLQYFESYWELEDISLLSYHLVLAKNGHLEQVRHLLRVPTKGRLSMNRNEDGCMEMTTIHKLK